jgi:hypothetical protein
MACSKLRFFVAKKVPNEFGTKVLHFEQKIRSFHKDPFIYNFKISRDSLWKSLTCRPPSVCCLWRAACRNRFLFRWCGPSAEICKKILCRKIRKPQDTLTSEASCFILIDSETTASQNSDSTHQKIIYQMCHFWSCFTIL